ncbi:MAG: type VI secretion system tube protein Hcp [Planctomycetes bacterium]|nr:type VI secretion system tube protein Hcp [Planctomycetota bacterium]
MPTPCNMLITGSGGPDQFKGGSEKEDRPGTIDVFEIEHHVHQPIDPTTGQATGVRVHNPLRVVAAIDPANPPLLKALCTGEKINTIELKFYHIDPVSRAEIDYYKITLTDARVVDCSPYMPMSFLPQNEAYRHMCQYSFVYEQIEWNFYEGGKVEMDKWRAPAGG